MYQRVYPSNEVPPNYKGNAFDRLPPGDECREHCENTECPQQTPAKKEISEILTRRDGRKFDLDDLILGGLIILLLNSHADDELLLILVLLFVIGL